MRGEIKVGILFIVAFLAVSIVGYSAMSGPMRCHWTGDHSCQTQLFDAHANARHHWGTFEGITD